MICISSKFYKIELLQAEDCEGSGIAKRLGMAPSRFAITTTTSQTICWFQVIAVVRVGSHPPVEMSAKGNGIGFLYLGSRDDLETSNHHLQISTAYKNRWIPIKRIPIKRDNHKCSHCPQIPNPKLRVGPQFPPIKTGLCQVVCKNQTQNCNQHRLVQRNCQRMMW